MDTVCSPNTHRPADEAQNYAFAGMWHASVGGGHFHSARVILKLTGKVCGQLSL